MTARTHHPAHDRLRADLKLIDRRIDAMAASLTEMDVDATSYLDRLSGIGDQLQGLRDNVDEWEEVEIGVVTRAARLSEDLDSLEADIRAGFESFLPAYEIAMDQQVRTWKSRLDNVRLQGVLGSMELRDELEGLSERLEQARAGVMLELQNAVDDSGDVVVDLRNDLEEVLVDVRHALERAYGALLNR